MNKNKCRVNVDELLKKHFDANKQAAEAAQAKGHALPTINEETERTLVDMQNALASGKPFDLRTKVGETAIGSMWQYEKSNDPDLARRYELVGTKRKDQQKFRHEWLQTKVDARLAELQKNEQETQQTGVRGRYRSISQLIKDEGHMGDLAAWEAIQQLVKNNTRMWQMGKLFRGRPCVKWSAQKNCLLYLELEDYLGDRNDRSWVKQETYPLPMANKVGKMETPPKPTAVAIRVTGKQGKGTCKST